MNAHVPYDTSSAGLPGLRQRRRYRPSGFFAPFFVPAFVSVSCAFFGVAFFGSLLAGALLESGPPLRVMGFLLCRILLPLAFCIGVSFLGAWAIRHGAVRRGWIAVGVSGFWALIFVAGWLLGDFATVMERIGQGGVALVELVFFVLFAYPLVWFVIFSIAMDDAFCVYYRTQDGGTWGERHYAWFKTGSANEVLRALEAGDAHQLAQLQGSGPITGAPAWQNYTALTLTTCPGDPRQPAYLHLKDIYMAGGPFYSSRIHGSYGLSPLRHVEISPDEVPRLYELAPALSGDGGARSSVDTDRLGPAPAAGFTGGGATPIGLPKGAPESARSPNGSFIGPVPPGERRWLRMRYIAGNFSFLWSLILMGVCAGIGATLLEGDDRTLAATIAGGTFLGLGILMIFATLVLCFTNGPATRFMVGRGVRSRPGSQAKGASRTLVLHIEDARTYHVMKFLPEDFGVLALFPGHIALEMSDFRALITAADLSLEIHETKAGTALKIAALIGEHPFAITVSDAGTSSLVAILRKPRDRATDLWKTIYEGVMAGQQGGND